MQIIDTPDMQNDEYRGQLVENVELEQHIYCIVSLMRISLVISTVPC